MAGLITLVNFSWLVFWVYWISAGIRAHATLLSRRAGRQSARFIFLVVLIVMAISFRANPTKLNERTTHHLAIRLIGLAIFYCGLALAIWARRNLGSSWNMPMAIVKQPKLITSGPYKYIRHPVYSGILLALLGSCLVAEYAWFVIFALVAIFMVYSSVQEEKTLASQIPKEYLPYKRRTKMLVPYVV